MAHKVETMAYVGQEPWHGLGVKLENPPTISEALTASGLDWTVGTRPLFLADGRGVTHRAMVRESDNSILGVVGPSYRPLQNTEAFQWFQPLLDNGMVDLHTAGSLEEGRKVWVLAKIRQQGGEVVPGDTVDRFILLSNSHDGSQAVRVGFTPIRVVCWNTLSLAHRDKASKLIRCLHFGNVVQTLDQIREVMNTANNEFEATVEQYRKLAACKISRRDLRKYVRKVLGFEATEEVKPVTQKIFDAVEKLFDMGKGMEVPGVKGTLWAAYNAMTEYLAYERGKTQETRLDSLWFGDSARLNREAFEVAMGLAV